MYNWCIIEKLYLFWNLTEEGDYMPEEAKTSKAQQKAVNKYVKNNYDRINVTFPKGQKEVIKEHAQKHGESVNAFIIRSVNETM